MWHKLYWNIRYWHDRFWNPVDEEAEDEGGMAPRARRQGPPDMYRDYTLAMYNDHATEVLLRAVK